MCMNQENKQKNVEADHDYRRGILEARKQQVLGCILLFMGVSVPFGLAVWRIIENTR